MINRFSSLSWYWYLRTILWGRVSTKPTCHVQQGDRKWISLAQVVGTPSSISAWTKGIQKVRLYCMFLPFFHSFVTVGSINWSLFRNFNIGIAISQPARWLVCPWSNCLSKICVLQKACIVRCLLQGLGATTFRAVWGWYLSYLIVSHRCWDMLGYRSCLNWNLDKIWQDVFRFGLRCMMQMCK